MHTKNLSVKCFFDFEFTGLHQNTTPISLGIVSNDGHKFYAEFTDYDKTQVDDWVMKNVICNLKIKNYVLPFEKELGADTMVKGTKEDVTKSLRNWVSRFKHVEFWGDCLWYDGVLLNEILGGAFNLPYNVDYLYYDIVTLFKFVNIDPDINRESFIDKPIEGDKHNALYDAEVIQACYDKIIRNKYDYLGI